MGIKYYLNQLNGLITDNYTGDKELPQLYSNIDYKVFEDNFNKIKEYRYFYRKTVKIVLFYSIYMDKNYNMENKNEENYFDFISKITSVNSYPVFLGDNQSMIGI